MFEESGEDPKLAKPVFHLRYWPAWMLEAVALILLGILAVCIPAMDPPVMRASAASVSWILALSAAVRFLKGQLIPSGLPGFWGAMLSSALAAAVGFALVGWPIPTSTPPISLLTRFCALQSFILIVSAAEYKYADTGRWELMLASGVAALLVSAALWIGLLPITAMTLGLPVAIVLTTEGVCAAHGQLCAALITPITNVTRRALMARMSDEPCSFTWHYFTA